MATSLKRPSVVNLAQLAEFDEVIDVRSPSEFREDHLPGAVNLPVLDDQERERVGTIYKQISPFEAKKIGAALVSRNIARHLDQYLSGKPRHWNPLVYCWRGGSRSGAMVTVLNQVGWRARQLEGGYKSYRREVLGQLEILPATFQFCVICGPTGAGKSRVLEALATLGAQVLDLERLAAHRGSVLGNLPDEAQPTQKYFDSLIWHKLRQFKTDQPIFVEPESKKIGRVQAPAALMDAMWRSQCIRLEASRSLRIKLLKEEYAHFIADTESLNRQLDCLAGLYGREQIQQWKNIAANGQWDDLVGVLLDRHYDPAYARSLTSHYSQYDKGIIIPVDDISTGGTLAVAKAILDLAPFPPPDFMRSAHALPPS